MGRREDRDVFAKPSRFAAKRALRAKQKARMKRRAIRIYPHMAPEHAATLADHIKLCSCPWCCGNPRSLYGDSFHDIRMKGAFPTDLSDWD